MIAPDRAQPMSRFLLIAAAVVFLGWGITQAQAVLVSLLVSVFLAVLATPPIRWLERKHVPRVAAVALVVTGMVLLLLASGVVIGSSISSFSAALPEYQERTQAQVMTLREFLARRSIQLPEDILLEYANPAAVMNLTAGLFMRLGSAFSNIVLIVLTVAFILLEAHSFPGKLRAVLGDPHQPFVPFTRFVDDMKRYMAIKTLSSLVTGVLITVLLYLLGVDFPVLWGFLAFLLNYIPSLGSIVAAAPAVLLAGIELGWWRAVLTAAGYLAVNLVLAYGVETRLLGRKLGLSTLVVFTSLIFWGGLLGPIGAVLCIPLTMTLKFAFESTPHTRWLAVLLEPATPAAAPLPGTHLDLGRNATVEPPAGYQRPTGGPHEEEDRREGPGGDRCQSYEIP